MKEILFEVREDEAEGGYTAFALGYAIATQGDTLEELREMVREAANATSATGSPARCLRLSAFTSSATRCSPCEAPA